MLVAGFLPVLEEKRVDGLCVHACGGVTQPRKKIMY